jgi:hypothetical protein
MTPTGDNYTGLKWDAIKEELLDVANFCMMIYCNITRETAPSKEARP